MGIQRPKVMSPPLSPYPLPIPPQEREKKKNQVKEFKNNLVAGFVQEESVFNSKPLMWAGNPWACEAYSVLLFTEPTCLLYMDTVAKATWPASNDLVSSGTNKLNEHLPIPPRLRHFVFAKPGVGVGCVCARVLFFFFFFWLTYK